MRNWMLLLLAALLLYAGCARAEDVYYTNNKDIYYHADSDCDRPKIEGREIYDRACYQKYPISDEAAQAFGKAACPVCAKGYAPVYLGEYPPEWSGEREPWGPLADDEAITMEMNRYRAECQDTYERFEAYYRDHPYPDHFAGVYMNRSGGSTYAVIDPTQDKLDSFKRMFGGGAWIVPAKYNYAYSYSDQVQTSATTTVGRRLEEWRSAHEDVDLHWVAIAFSAKDSVVEVEMYGEDWETAMPMIDAELDLPVWVCFVRNTSYYDEENMWF